MELYIPDVNPSLKMSEEKQANILTILMEEYGIAAWPCAYQEGQFYNFLHFRDCECPLCHKVHGDNTIVIANDRAGKYSTFFLCHKTHEHRDLGFRYPF